VSADQTIPPDVYTLLKFPSAEESADAWNMHTGSSADGKLIWPHVSGWGTMEAVIQWEGGTYTELRDQFIRDPLRDPDTTGTEHRAPSPGIQCFAKSHGIFVNTETPLGLAVSHNHPGPRKIIYAQFKLIINTDVATP
jgi:hypothetical protein